MNPQPKRGRTMLIIGAAAVGAALGGAGIAGAATASTASTNAATVAAASSTGSAPNPATLAHGPGETLLTGTTADKVKAAALAAVPGGTIIRVETDSAGSPYEAHITKSDGATVTVKIDTSFAVTGIESGFGAGPPGAGAPNGSGAPGYGPSA